jgi:outer membrane protein
MNVSILSGRSSASDFWRIEGRPGAMASIKSGIALALAASAWPLPGAAAEVVDTTKTGAEDGSTAAVAAPEAVPCTEGVCRIRLTPQQLLANAEQLVAQGRYADAAPMLAALEVIPELSMQRQFLTGYSAIETGDVDGAIKVFRAALVKHPEQTRIRLELARALMIKGKTGSADYHFRLAQQDKTLPDDVLKTVAVSRGILRSQRQWNFNLDFGFAPDTNITNGTSATTVDANFGGVNVPLTLDSAAREKSGTGQTLGLSGGIKLGLKGETRLVVDADLRAINYKGQRFDDINGVLAVGPSFKLSDRATLSVQGIANQRYYGGQRAQTGLGGRTSLQFDIGETQRLGLTLDARHNNSGFARDYSGWNLAAYASYERVVSKRFIASASLYGRRDALNSKAYSNREFGAIMGIGGELPMGINAGASIGVARAKYDAPLNLFSIKPRGDTRFNANLNVGLRQFRWWGFSPSINYSFTKTMSSLSLYDSKRHRVAFSFARYF